MYLINGWIICNKSLYKNFTRIKKDSISGFLYYVGEVRDKHGYIEKNQNYIRFLVHGQDVDIYYETEKKLKPAFEELEKIMWDFEFESKDEIGEFG